MSPKKLTSKPCKCPEQCFQWIQKQEQKTTGSLTEVHSFEEKVCKNHNYIWGARRKENIRTICLTPISKFNLGDDERQFFKKVYSKLNVGKMNLNEWNKNVKDIFRYSEILDVRNKTTSFIQKGLIIQQIEKIRSAGEEKTYVELTPEGRSRIATELRVLTTEDQITLIKDKIEIVLKGQMGNNPPSIFLRELLDYQLKLIKEGNPHWMFGEEGILDPKIKVNKDPVYFIISYALATWYVIWRPKLTVRELSARAFHEIYYLFDKDPSKILPPHISKFNEILSHYSKKFNQEVQSEQRFYWGDDKTCESMGLISHMQNIEICGNLTIDDKNYTGNAISLDSQQFSGAFKMTTTSQKILLVENLAIFIQISMDNWVQKANTLVFYIHGKGKVENVIQIIRFMFKFQQAIPIWIWVDHDLGGIEISNTVLNEISSDSIKIITIPRDLSITYRPIPEERLSKIEKYHQDYNLEIGKYALHVSSNGIIEQEFLLEWYDYILNANFENSI